MGVTRKEKFLKAMLSDNAEACRGGVTREEKMLASVAHKTCENDALEDKIAYDKTITLEWDGNIEGRTVTVNHTVLANGRYVKVSDMSIDGTVKSASVTFDSGMGMDLPMYGVTAFDSGAIMMGESMAVYAPEDNFEFVRNESSEAVVFPEKGVYFTYNPLDSGVVQYAKMLKFRILKTIDEKYLPNTSIVITYDGTNYTCNVPFDEFEAAILAGYPLVYVDTNDKWSSSNASVSYNHDGEYWAVRAVNTYEEVTVTLKVTESGVKKAGVA